MYMSIILMLCSAKNIEVDGRVITLTHAQVCRGTCTVDRCTHRSHRTRKHKKRMVTPKEQRDAILAGFKPPTHVEFKDVLQKKLQKDGMDMYVQSYSCILNPCVVHCRCVCVMLAMILLLRLNYPGLSKLRRSTW